MSEFYDDRDDEINEELEDAEEVEDDYQENDEDFDALESRPEIAAPVSIPGKEESRTWNPDSAYGIQSTTAEGALGRRLRKFGKAARTPQERFRDNVERVGSSNNTGVDRGTVETVISNIGIIPDVQFKSPAGCLLGWMFRPFIGKKLTASERTSADAILAKVDQIKDKFLQIDKLNVIAYARAWKLWTDVARGKIVV
jgi:hypothetical protein